VLRARALREPHAAWAEAAAAVGVPEQLRATAQQAIAGAPAAALDRTVLGALPDVGVAMPDAAAIPSAATAIPSAAAALPTGAAALSAKLAAARGMAAPLVDGDGTALPGAAEAAQLALAAGGAVSFDASGRLSVDPPPAGLGAPGIPAAPAIPGVPGAAPTANAAAPAPAPEVAPAEALAPEPSAPQAPTPSSVGPVGAAGTPAAAAIDPEELYEQVVRRLRREVMHERELRGELL
jgi:hypothetical protein